MNKIALCLLTFFGFILLTPEIVCAQLKKERIQASYLLATGRLPTPAEFDWWNKQVDLPVANLVDAHRTYMNKTNGDSKDDIIKKTYFIAFGRNPSTGPNSETAFWKTRSEVFWEMLPVHVNHLNQYKSTYDGVIANAYQLLFKKTPSAAELNKWKSQQVRSFAELVYLLYKTPPAGYSIDPSAVLIAMGYYNDFSNTSFSEPVVREISAITGGNDLYNKFKGLR